MAIITEKEVHISTIVAGDTVRHNGDLRTVCNCDLGRSEMMGLTLFGDSYHMGYKTVTKVIIANPRSFSVNK